MYVLVLITSIACSYARPFENINVFSYKIICSELIIFVFKIIKQKERFKGIMGI